MSKHLRHILSLLFAFLLFAFSFLLSAFSLQAQQLKLGNNPTQIEKSAVLELQSKNQGLLLTRVPDTSTSSVIFNLHPPDGMIIYFTDTTAGLAASGMNAGLYIRKDGAWKKLVAEDENGIETINGDHTKDQIFDISLGAPAGGSSYTSSQFVTDNNGHITLQLAGASTGRVGVVTEGYQTWSGNKRFIDAIGVESLSPGSVPFIGDDPYNYLSEDNNKFFWDNVNGRLGVGTNSPGNTLEVNAPGKSGLRLTNLPGSTIDATASTIGVNSSGDVVKTGRTFNNSASRDLIAIYGPFSQDLYVSYSISIGATSLLALLSSNTTVYLEISPNNTFTPVVDTVSQVASNVASLLTKVSVTLILSGWVPKGYYFRMVSNPIPASTVTVKGQEVLMP